MRYATRGSSFDLKLIVLGDKQVDPKISNPTPFSTLGISANPSRPAATHQRKGDSKNLFLHPKINDNNVFYPPPIISLKLILKYF
jgi:hypothetical protein